jgi:hypothetical protein
MADLHQADGDPIIVNPSYVSPPQPCQVVLESGEPCRARTNYLKIGQGSIEAWCPDHFPHRPPEDRGLVSPALAAHLAEEAEKLK